MKYKVKYQQHRKFTPINRTKCDVCGVIRNWKCYALHCSCGAKTFADTFDALRYCSRCGKDWGQPK